MGMITKNKWQKRRIILVLCTFSALPLSAQTLALPGDGKDFFIGYITASYVKVADSSVASYFGAYVLVSSYTNNIVAVSYFDKNTGVESINKTYFIAARTGIQIPLDLSFMRMQDSGDIPEFL